MIIINNKIHKYLQSGRSWYQRDPKEISKITVHHSAMRQDGRQTDESIMEAIKRAHVGNGWPGLSYHFVITPNGNIYQTNNFTDIIWHDTINDDSISILAHGYFHPSVNEVPTQAQLKSLKELLDDLSIKHPEFPADQDDVVGHRERSATACPGDNLIKYVVEYREKKGQVNWISTFNKCEKDLAEMTKNKDEWKEKSRIKDEEIKKLKEDILAKDKQYELLKGAMSAMEESRNEAVEKANKYSRELLTAKDNLKVSLDVNLSLTEDMKRLKEQEYNLSEIVSILTKYLKRVYESKKLF